MPSVTELIRAHLERNLRIQRPGFDELMRTERSKLFERACQNRLVMGALRYQTFAEKAEGHTYDTIEYIEMKIKKYRKTGNVECLCDISNLAAIEFEYPSHPTPNWSPEDDKHHVRKK